MPLTLLGCYNARLLHKAVRLLGIRYCAKLLGCYNASILLKAVRC